MTYKKALKLQGIGKDAGKIVNIVAVDAQCVFRFCTQTRPNLIHFFVDFRILSDTFGVYVIGLTGPVQIIIGTGLLWQRIGAFALLPFGTFLVSLPIVGFLNSIYARRLETTKTATDSRLKLVRELLSAIRIIKYYAWELPFEQNIQRFRTNEVDRQKATTTVRIGGISTFAAVSPISTGLIFCLYAIGNAFQVTTIFTTVALVNMMRTPFQFLPLVIVFSSQYKVALTRVREFCLRPEPERNQKPTSSSKSKSTAIYMKKASFAWDAPADTDVELAGPAAPVLSDVDLRVKLGSVTMVVGAVGSGKSTLVSGVLGEVPHVSGTVEVSADISYVPQEAWIINASVRSNILFGKPYDEKLYKEVLRASALETDLKIMPLGDATEIGDRGINLSGGQKQRVSIARALYADRDLYVFDDPFSAVDSHVAKHLVENAVGKFLRSRGKTAFIITNQLQFLHVADHIVFLKNGHVAEQGSFDKLMENGAEFKQLVKDFGVAKENKSASTSSDSDSAETESPKGEKDSKSVKKASKKTSKSSKLDLTSPDVTRKAADPASEKKLVVAEAATASNAEEMEKGAITFATYWHYISSGGSFMFFFSVFLMFVIAGFRVFNSIWLSWWADPNPAVSGRWVRDTCMLDRIFLRFQDTWTNKLFSS
jgi:ABC-type multidrug transport system fused ATPase/permease subunit